MVVMNTESIFSADRRAQLFKEYSMTDQTAALDVDLLKQWARKQPHLPDIGALGDCLDTWLEGMLLLNKNSVERAKRSVDNYFTARITCPTVFSRRDLSLDQDLKDSFDHVKVAMLPGLTDEGHRVLLMKIDNEDASFYQLEAHMKRCAMMVDIYLRHGVDFTGLHVIHDLEHVGLGHVSKFTLQYLKLMANGMKAYPCRIPQITLINTPSFVDKVIGLFRAFISPKLMARIQSYKDGSQLLDILPARLVPKDYGGDATSLDELNGLWRTKMVQHTDFYALCDSLKTDEKKREGKSRANSTTNFGQNGTFRQISLD